MEKTKESTTKSLSKKPWEERQERQKKLKEKQQEVVIEQRKKREAREAVIQKRIEETYDIFPRKPSTSVVGVRQKYTKNI